MSVRRQNEFHITSGESSNFVISVHRLDSSSKQVWILDASTGNSISTVGLNNNLDAIAIEYDRDTHRIFGLSGINSENEHIRIQEQSYHDMCSHFRWLLSEADKRAGLMGRHIVIFIDGLDELEGSSDVAWLPHPLPGNTQVVLSQQCPAFARTLRESCLDFAQRIAGHMYAGARIADQPAGASWSICSSRFGLLWPWSSRGRCSDEGRLAADIFSHLPYL